MLGRGTADDVLDLVEEQDRPPAPADQAMREREVADPLRGAGLVALVVGLADREDRAIERGTERGREGGLAGAGRADEEEVDALARVERAGDECAKPVDAGLHVVEGGEPELRGDGLAEQGPDGVAVGRPQHAGLHEARAPREPQTDLLRGDTGQQPEQRGVGMHVRVAAEHAGRDPVDQGLEERVGDIRLDDTQQRLLLRVQRQGLDEAPEAGCAGSVASPAGEPGRQPGVEAPPVGQLRHR
jgi:hypothetical protein